MKRGAGRVRGDRAAGTLCYRDQRSLSLEQGGWHERDGMPNGELIAMRGVGHALPPDRWDSAAIERRIRETNPGLELATGLLAHLSGIRERRYAADGVNASDLAAQAALSALAAAGRRADEVDLLIFASASQDLAEPATAHIIQDLLGTRAAVFDIKNACNSFLNGVQIAEALLLAGQHRLALVVSGEIPSRSVRWQAAGREELLRNLVGYTMGDAGGATVLEPATDGSGIIFRRFLAASQFWPAATIPGGGTRHPRGDEYTYIQGNGGDLKEAFVTLGPGLLQEALAETETHLDDIAVFLVHQVTLPYLRDFVRHTGIPWERIEVTIEDLGNMAASSLPVAFVRAQEAGRIRPGDLVAWIGLAAGISAGVMLVRV